MASTYPSSAVKKKEMALAACASVSAFGSVGLSADEPRAVEVNTLFRVFANTVETMFGLPEAARSGVLKYA